jgi:hypothetical protein
MKINRAMIRLLRPVHLTVEADMDYYELMAELRFLKSKYREAPMDKRDIFSLFYPHRNFVTNNLSGYLLLNGGNHIVELSWGRFIDHYIYGVTVVTRFRDGIWRANADLSRSFNEGEEVELAGYLDKIHEGVE